MRFAFVLVFAAIFLVPSFADRFAGAAAPVYYEPTIRDIVQKDCSRCHSGAMRNLMSYDAIKAYADSGMLSAMVGSMMRQFAGADAGTIISWADAGAMRRAPGAGARSQAQPGAQAATVAQTTAKVYYESTIRDIIQKDCARCHSGATRNLTDWDSVRAFVDNGMLAAMVQGPMRRFAGADADVILAWIDAGAPENPPRIGGAAAAFNQPTRGGQPRQPGQPGQPGRGGGGGQFACPPGAGGQVAPGDLTYTGTIEGLMAQDCLRCHLGPFRKMTTYEDVKMYVDNGLLKTLVEPGGPMHRFAGPDTRVFLAWIDAGAPR
ncbi:hypothetical protein [Solidesulfovibrio magneticus]|nr:hypothetical protein [Solidesulfovibrio magneticus]